MPFPSQGEDGASQRGQGLFGAPPGLPPGHAKWGGGSQGAGAEAVSGSRRDRSTAPYRVPPLQAPSRLRAGRHVATCQSQLCQCWGGTGGGAVLETEGGGRGGKRRGLWTRRGGHALSNPGGTGREPLEVGGETEARRGYRPGPPATQVARGWPSGRKPQLLPTQLAQRNGDPLPALCRSPPRRREPTHWSCIAAIYNTLSPGGMGGQGQGGAPPL